MQLTDAAGFEICYKNEEIKFQKNHLGIFLTEISKICLGKFQKIMIGIGLLDLFTLELSFLFNHSFLSKLVCVKSCL